MRIKEVPFILVSMMLVCAPLLFVPLFNHSFTQGKGLFFVFMMLVLGIWFSYFYLKPKTTINNIKNSNFLIALLGMYGVFTFTNSLTIHSEVVFYGSISRGLGFNILLLCVALSLVTAFYIRTQHVQNLLKLSLIPAALSAAYALIQKSGYEFFFINYGLDIFEGRSFGFYGNPSYLGQALSLFCIIALYFLFTSKKKNQIILYSLITVLLFSGIVVSGTRTSILGLLVAAILMVLWMLFKKIHLSKKQFIAIIIGCVMSLSIAALYAPSRFSFSSLATRSLNSRLEIWKGAVELISRNPVIGYGTNTFQIYFPDVVSKDFYALEENLTLNVDRVHNETLEVFFQYGALGGIAYFIFLGVVFLTFFKSKSPIETVLALLILTYHAQNQVSFPDISIMIFIYICYGGLCSVDANRKDFRIKNKFKRWIVALLILLFVGFFGYTSFYNPLRSEIAYTRSQKARTKSYDEAVLNLKEAVSYMPYYTELWYELMMIDPSSRSRGIYYLTQLEGDTGNVNAWVGNLYAKTDPEIATKYYLKALERNPYHPNWIRAFADMLYFQEDYENALFMYSKYLDAIPEIWYVDEAYQNDPVLKKKSRIFLKNTPYLNEVFEKIQHIKDISEELE